MSETSSPAGTRPKELRRVPDGAEGRIIGGVAGGLGRYTDVDPVIFRVLFGALTFVSGLGLGLYALGWLLIPVEGQTDTRGAHILNRLALRRRWVVWTLVGLLIWAATSDNGPWWHGRFFFPPVLIVVAIIILINSRHTSRWHRQHRAVLWRSTTSPAATESTAATVDAASTTGDVMAESEPVATSFTTASFASAPTAAYPVPPVKLSAPRPSRALAPTFALLVGVWAVLALLGTTGTVSISPLGVVAATLLVLTGGLVGAAILGRSWLLILAELAAIVGLIVTVPLPSGIGWSAGNESWSPQSVNELPHAYKLAAGAATLDLSHTQGLQGRTVRATVGAGNLVVEVPANLPVQLHAHVSAGVIHADGRLWKGVGVDRRELVPGTQPGLIPLTLDLNVGYGQITLREGLVVQ